MVATPWASSIRRALGVTPAEWRALKADDANGDPSPLALAIEEGRAEGAGQIITFMRGQLAQGSFTAATWLAEHVYKITKPAPGDSGPRVNIFLPAPMSDDEFRRIVDVTPRPKELSHG